MQKLYLPRAGGGRWAISRQIGDRWIGLIQDTPVSHPGDVTLVLRELDIPLSLANIRRYFPSNRRGRCPTLELLEIFAGLADRREECGV